MSPENKPENNVGTQIPHSGRHGDEFPVREFDRTSLQEATDSGKITIPENTRSLQSTGEIPVVTKPVETWTQRQPGERKEVKKNQKGLKYAGVGLAGVALLGAGFAVAQLGGGGAEVEPQQTTAPEVNETPGEVVVPAPVETSPTDIPGSETEQGATQEVLVQTISVEAMDAMSIDQFATLSYADRAAYAYIKNPNLPSPDQTEEFNPAAIGYYWDTLERTAISTADTTEGAKTIAARIYYTTDKTTGSITEGYQTAVNSILNTGGEGVGMNGGIRYIDSGEFQTGFDRNGVDEIEFINITTQRYDSKNVPVGPEVTSQVIPTTIKLEDGRTIVTYPAAYSIDGKASPIEGGTY